MLTYRLTLIILSFNNKKASSLKQIGRPLSYMYIYTTSYHILIVLWPISEFLNSRPEKSLRPNQKNSGPKSMPEYFASVLSFPCCRKFALTCTSRVAKRPRAPRGGPARAHQGLYSRPRPIHSKAAILPCSRIIITPLTSGAAPGLGRPARQCHSNL